MNRNSVVWAAVIAVAFVAAGAGVVFLWPQQDAGKECCDQIRKGMPWPQAKKILTDAGFQEWDAPTDYVYRQVRCVHTRDKYNSDVIVEIRDESVDMIVARQMYPESRVDRFWRRLGIAGGQ